jgi:DNA processing protein
MLDDGEFAAWFRLAETPGLSRAAARALLAAFGSPEAAVGAAPPQWRAVAGDAAASALAATPVDLAARRDAAAAWRRADPAHHVVVLGDPGYPTSLLGTADPPLMLYVQGEVRALQGDAIAVVGSRNPTAQGVDNAREFARFLSDAGLTVVSGLALGIDAAAHRGALAGATPTVAVVGTGVDRVYPSRHRDLAHRIAERGAIVSEFSPGMPPLKENFPQRNRIIAGLTRGTLVVEAALRSGSLITARLAAEAGREVFAVPGSIHAPQSRGCHWLIKQGAKLVDSAADILEELAPHAGPAAKGAQPPAPGHEDALLEAMGHDPVTLDALSARTGQALSILAARLLELELEGRVARLPGGLYQRRAAG